MMGAVKFADTVADAISRLEYNPKLYSTNEYNHATQGVSTKELAHHRWNTFSKHWLGYNESNSLSNTDIERKSGAYFLAMLTCKVERIFVDETEWLLAHLYFAP